MACLENACQDCGHVEFSNSKIYNCPLCDSMRVVAFWDEEHDDWTADDLNIENLSIDEDY